MVKEDGNFVSLIVYCIKHLLGRHPAFIRTSFGGHEITPAAYIGFPTVTAVTLDLGFHRQVYLGYARVRQGRQVRQGTLGSSGFHRQPRDRHAPHLDVTGTSRTPLRARVSSPVRSLPSRTVLWRREPVTSDYNTVRIYANSLINLKHNKTGYAQPLWHTVGCRRRCQNDI
jgi:hypothetical protein